MKIAIDLVCTINNSGSKTYNSKFIKYLSKLKLDSEITIYICRGLYRSLKNELISNSNIKYEVKSDVMSTTLIKLFWMQFLLPLD